MTKAPIEVSESMGRAVLVYQQQIEEEPGQVVTCEFAVCDNF